MSQTQPSVIFILSLDDTWHPKIFQDVCGRLMNTIAERAVVKQAKNTQEALDLFNGDDRPQAVFVTDSSVTTPENAIVSDMLTDFARNGGIVVLGGLFSSSIRPNELRSYFQKWDLPWRVGSYHRTTVALNQTAEGVPRRELPSSFSQKALFLADVARSAAWYLPNESSVVESGIFPSQAVPTSETPAALTKVGSGWLGYIGDVKTEKSTDLVVLAMLGLL